MLTIGMGVAALGGLFASVLDAQTAQAWGGYQNGRIPTSALTKIPWSEYYLEANAAQALIRLNSAFRSAFNRNVPISDGYRNYDNQVAARNYWCSLNKCGFAAVPGESNHGWARAIDIGVGQTDWQNPIYLWFKQNAGRYGWIHPDWAEPGGRYPEAWHWEYTGGGDQEPVPEKKPSSGVSETIMYIRRQSTGEIAIFGGNFRQSNGGQTGRHLFANLDEYGSWRRVVTAYNSEVRRVGLPTENLIPEPPANASDVLGLGEGDWSVVCAVYGV